MMKLLKLYALLGAFCFSATADAYVFGLPASPTFAGNVTVNGDLTVNGDTTATIGGQNVCLQDGTNCDATPSVTTLSATGAISGASVSATGQVSGASLSISGSSATVNGQNICLADGTNCDAGSAVTGFARGNVTYTRNTYTANTSVVSTNQAASASESYGPTGSGADNIWTALDSLPTGTTAVILSCYLSYTSDGGTVGVPQSYMFLDGKAGNVTVIPDATTRLCAHGIDTASGERGLHTSHAFISVDSNGVFSLTYTAINTSADYAAIDLVGFIVAQ